MTQNDILLVQSSWHKAVPARKAIAELFYLKLFQLDPAMRDMFVADIERQRAKFLQMMSATIRALDRLEALLPVLRELGTRHSMRGVRDEHHATVATALLWTLEKALRADFTPEIKSAWIKTYGVLSLTMREAGASYSTTSTKPPRPRISISPEVALFSSGK
jgi:nitric oxide dioxygenase